jgi:hypothetical protein
LLRFILIFILLPNLVFGACDKPVSYLQENEKAPCTGYLLTPEKEYEVRTKVYQFDKLNELVNKQDEIISVLNKRVENQIAYSTLLQNELQERKEKDFWRNSLYFLLGALVTGAVSVAVINNVR